MNEQIKQQILNGAYGITRDGRKAKYVDKYASSEYPYYFIFLDDDNEIDNATALTKEFTEYVDSSSKLDIVGLWKEPFNLERALQGEPVKLRNGHKAFVKFQVPAEYSDVNYPLIGYQIYNDNSIGHRHWTITGSCNMENDSQANFDIVGMWSEPKEQLNLLPPKALKEPTEGMWFLDLNREEIYQSSYTKEEPNSINSKAFNLGMYFDSEEKAKAMLYFLKNNKE